MMLQTYEVVSHIEADYQPEEEDSNYYYAKFHMRNDILKVLRVWFGVPKDKTVYVVFVQPGKLAIHGTFRFDPDDLADASHKLDEIVFKAAKDNGVGISGWISFVPVDFGYEMIPNWREII